MTGPAPAGLPDGLRSGPVRVRVPGTSANLGPGFDAYGLALGVHDEVEARAVPEPGVRVEVSGEGVATVDRGDANLVARTATAVVDLLLDAPVEQQPVRFGLQLTCLNALPHGRGLGSSAAAIVSGALLGRALVEGGDERMDDAALLAWCSAAEGHPDNVAACLLGGFTMAWTAADGVARAVQLRVADGVAPVLLVPPFSSSTAEVRRLLPATVPHADAAAGAGRAGLLAVALTSRPDLLLTATEDRLHQPYRRPAMPRSAELVDALRADGVAAVISGAGPTVLALCRPDQVADALARVPDGWRALEPGVDAVGARVLTTLSG